MINSFKDYLIEEERVVYFTFGRMNPPTIGHGKLIDKLASTAGRNPYRIFVSQSQDPKKNPLNYSDKIKNIRRMFPKHARNVMINKNVKSAMDIMSNLYDQGFRKVVMVVGSDRVNEFSALLNKYNGNDGRHGFYNFSDIKVISAGERDPDAEGIEGMSASKMRNFASVNDFVSFSQGLPKTASTKDARKLFNDVRKGMGLKEEKTFKNHVQLDPISSTRESFVKGQLFDLGESVIIKKTDEVGTIVVLGSNYVIVESSEGKRARYWLDAVEKIVEQDNKKSMYKDKPDWGTPESTKKAKKMTPGQMEESLWANIRKRRASGKPKLKPGDKGYPKTLNIEQKDPVDAAKLRVQRQKEIAARRHDQIMDRARLLKTKQQNQETK